ncbi:hypothetical protein [Aneurinibacillus migulanus]|uniref:Uncharacterized protein n=1 Tax=Aneurinibacillus migulanus TaxID=47500 RepID=A0A0D1VV90_ANEMI|nr:hypothetical protein [Aneurinibacillus migulanus]KIV50150.1 hypothetical protein TS65_30425 [Aneurinibacillus migulanus]KON96182.1 hypothetical protein AF333_12510 [Aneurinibacillus migulanus]MED0894537.1 hypothetical protein [Aneurinibacillus migulanus]MED1616233.1 hypothetical protein [Aneurinibacillus migulanus]
MEKEEGGYALRPGKKRRTCLFPTVPAHRPSFFSYLSPQEFVDLSNRMYIEWGYFFVFGILFGE